MKTLAKLFSIEWLKVRRRSIFWVAIVAHATIIGVGTGAQQYMHAMNEKSAPFMLPKDWSMLITVGSQVGMLMLLIAVTLLTTSESTWRTQRQNVIDGLSRLQYFSAKIIVVVLLALIMWVDISLVGLLVAPFGGSGALTMPVFSALAQDMLPNVLLYLVAMGVTAFMFGLIASTSGAALGLMFAFVVVKPIIGSIMKASGGLLPKISTYLPLDVFGNLVSAASYDADRAASMKEMLLKIGQPEPLSLHMSALVTTIYILVFIGIAWLSFRERDL